MAFSIGELFVSLGFDVDDTKLKSFNEQIITARDGLFKVAAGASAAVLAVGEFISGPINQASVFKQFHDQTGYSAQGMQEWARAISIFNNTISFDRAINEYQRLSDYVLKIPIGGSGGALAQLLPNFHPGRDPKEYLQQLADAAQSGYWEKIWPGISKSIVTQKLSQIGLGPEVYDALTKTDAQRAAATKGLVQTDAQIEANDRLNTQVRELGRQYEALAIKFTAEYGPQILKILQDFEQELPKIIKEVNDVAKAFGGWKSVGELILIYFGTTWAAGMIAVIARITLALRAVTVAALASGIPGAGLVAGIAGGAGLLGTAAVGGGALVGGFAAGAGIMKATGWDKDFANWAVPLDGRKNVLARSMDSIYGIIEYSKNMKAGPRVENSSSPEVTINIHSNQDPKALSEEVKKQFDREMDRIHNNANTQTNLGAQY